VFSNLDLAHPILGPSVKVNTVTVVNVFDSQARPCRLSFTTKDGDFDMIFKCGDDLRQDVNVQVMFFVFNKLWQAANLENTPFIHQYRIIPTGLKHGLIEFVKGCRTVRELENDGNGWEAVHQMEDHKLRKLIASIAGGMVGSYIMGVRDRHKDNMMMKGDDTYFPIDFGHLFNQGPVIDAGLFAMPAQLISCLEHKWNELKELCIQAFKVLRLQATLIVNFTEKLFPQNLGRDWVRDSFMLLRPEESACEKISGRLDKEWNTWSAIAKNLIHQMRHTQ